MTDPNDDLRQLLNDATSGIRPEGTFEEIRSRTQKVDPMARRWFLPSIAAAAVMALVIGGAFYVNRDDGSKASPSDGTQAVVRAVPIYFVGPAARGERLYREFQDMSICPSADCLLEAATFGAVAAEPLDKDYRMPWPSGMEAPKARYADDQIIIDLAGSNVAERPASMTATQAQLAVQQLVYSAQAGLGKGRVPVLILLDGKPTATILGIPASEPLNAASEDDTLALVQITSPTENQKVKAGEKFTVTGVANAFEANVQWELLVGGDAVADSGFTTAEECCRLAPYSFDLTLEPGTYTLEVHDSDESGTGRPINRDTKEIVVE